MRRCIRIRAFLRLIKIVSKKTVNILFRCANLTLIQPTELRLNTLSSSLTRPRLLSSAPRPPTLTPLTQPSKPRTMFPELLVSSRYAPSTLKICSSSAASCSSSLRFFSRVPRRVVRSCS
jgi:hypothetical protein